MTAPFLEIHNVTKVFHPDEEQKLTALADINLEIVNGEFTVLSGPSGSGKTTLLNIIGGLDSATRGTVILSGMDLTTMSEAELSLVRRDHIGFVFQAYNLIPVLTARENIEYVMKLQARGEKECRSRTNEIAEKLGIASLLEKLPHQMSGGQQQRVAVARAVAAKPELVLADEPTANLDSATASELMDMLQRLNEDEGVTVIFSSHDPLVIGKARRSIVIRDGMIVQDD